MCVINPDQYQDHIRNDPKIHQIPKSHMPGKDQNDNDKNIKR